MKGCRLNDGRKRGRNMNISSIVVRTTPEKLTKVIEDLKASGVCEVHFQDTTGKIIITVEGEDISEEMRKMKAIQNIPDVISANLAYSYSEKEMQEAMELIKKADAVPALLKNDSSDTEDSGTA
jgi:periplasmic nitrate reductase NapD